MQACRLIILLVCNLIITRAFPQQGLHYFFRHIDQADGLLHNQVLAITQDGKGFIWIATTNGLQRYDGSRFVNYQEMLSNPAQGLTTGVVMYADKRSNLLWITNNTELEKMELVTNKFTAYQGKNSLWGLSLADTSYRGAKGEGWSAAIDHINTNVFPANTHRTSFVAADSISGRTWLASESGLFLLDKTTKRVYSDKFNPEHHPLLAPAFCGAGKKLLRFIMTDSRQNTWVTTWGDLFYKYDAVTKKISTYSLSAIKAREECRKASSAGLLINCMLEDNDHTLWIATENAGLLRYNSGNDSFDYCTARGKKDENIRYDYKLLSLFQDKEQNIWVGTDKGISIFNPYRVFFNAVRHEENNSLSIGKSEILSFIQTTGGDMFIGTWGSGMAVYDSGLRFKRNILFGGPAEKNFIWSFVQADDKTVWIGCQHGYLLIYNITTGATRTLHPPEMEGFTIRCMEKDNKGNIWFGLHNGKIAGWDKKLGRFFHYGGGPRDSLKRTSFIDNIFIDKEQDCWVSTETGFKEFDLKARRFIHTWVPDRKNPGCLYGSSCQGIEEYNDSILLIGTIYGGLNFFNKRRRTFTHLGTADGLPANTVYAIKKDDLGYIWLTTDYGIYKFNPSEKKFIRYSLEPGLLNSSFKANKFYPLKDGQWLTFTLAEAIRWFPFKVEYPENSRPKIEITGFKVFDKPVFIDSLLFKGKPVWLSYKENFFTVEFAVLNFTGLQQINYYYRLGDVDKDWVNGGTKRFASYTDLQPGEYEFHVRSENGDHGGETASFKIIIAPPFWKTPWFGILLLALISSVIYTIVKWRMNTIRKQEKTKMLFDKEMAEMEMKALRSQMNPHFIFNCINSIDGLIQSNDKYHATVYLNKFAKLLRNILDSSKQNAVLFSKDIQTLKLYIELEELRHENKFIVIFKIDPELLSSDYRVPPLVIQPFVENAILHGLKNKDGNDGILCIEIIKAEKNIHYTITDNGFGRTAAAWVTQNKEPPKCLQMTLDRIKLFNKEETASVEVRDLYYNEDPAGTEVRVNLNII